MKYYSQVTKQLYDSTAELVKAERAVEQKRIAAEKAEKAKREERASRAKEVENALKAANEMQVKAAQLLQNFTKDYGYFHMSYTSDENENETEDAADIFLNLLNDFLA